MSFGVELGKISKCFVGWYWFVSELREKFRLGQGKTKVFVSSCKVRVDQI